MICASFSQHSRPHTASPLDPKPGCASPLQDGALGFRSFQHVVSPDGSCVAGHEGDGVMSAGPAKTAPSIFGWLNAVKADRRLRGSCFKVAYQLAQKINAAEFEKSGKLVTWQSERTIADAIQMSERTVRAMVHRLRDTDHLEIKTGHGPGSSNRYTLKYRQPPAEFNGAKTGSQLPHSDKQMRQSDVSKPAVHRMKTGSQLPPNYSISNSIISAREPRRAEEALGPLGAELRKRIDPATFDAWFTKGEVEAVSQTADTITLAVRSKFFAEQIRNRFESDILACLPGVARVEVVIKERDGRRDLAVTGTGT